MPGLGSPESPYWKSSWEQIPEGSLEYDEMRTFKEHRSRILLGHQGRAETEGSKGVKTLTPKGFIKYVVQRSSAIPEDVSKSFTLISPFYMSRYLDFLGHWAFHWS